MDDPAVQRDGAGAVEEYAVIAVPAERHQQRGNPLTFFRLGPLGIEFEIFSQRTERQMFIGCQMGKDQIMQHLAVARGEITDHCFRPLIAILGSSVRFVGRPFLEVDEGIQEWQPLFL